MSTSPTALSFTFRATLGLPYTVELQHGVVRFGTGEPSNPLDGEIRPTEETWIEFRERLDATGVSEWQEDYTDPTVLDGWEWSFEVAYPDLEVRSGGVNSYPDSDGLPTSSKNQGLRSLIRALQALTGNADLAEAVFG